MRDETCSSSVSGARPQLVYIQYLRGFAALMVVAFHARNPQPWLYNPVEKLIFATTGVDIFFVISGFVMFTAARAEKPLDFAWRRITRIVPLYWIATLTWLLVRLVMGYLPSRADLPAHLVQSLLFIPHFDPENPTQVWPFLVPGWTLQYEMFFYALFMIGLALARPVAFVALAIVTLGTIGLVYAPTGAGLQIVTNPMLLEFLFGTVIGLAYRRLSFRRLGPLLPIGLVSICLVDINPMPWLISAGVPAAAIVIGALALERHGRSTIIPAARLIGDSSYAIYLFHIPVLALVSAYFWKLPVHGLAQFLLWLASGLCLSVGAGVLAHLYLERPLLKRLKTRRFVAR